jgi:tape measure domain-containing protein
MEYLAAHKRENERLAKLDKADRDRRAAVQRKWEKRRKRNALAAQKERNDALLVQQKAAAKKQKALYDIQNLGNRRKPGLMGTLEFHGQRFKSSGIGSFVGSASKMIGKLTVGLFVFEQALKRVGAAIGAVVGAMISLVKASDKKKKQILTLTTLYGGNREAALKLRGELEAYAKATSFSVEGTMELAVQLRALGFSAEETIKSIKSFGKLSFGDASKMKLIAKAYSDVRAQGRLMATEVRQFANQGVPLLIELQRQLGMSAAELKKAIESGLVSFEDVDKALASISDRFGNIDKAGMKTFTGQMEAAGEEWERFKANLAETTELDAFFLRMARGLNNLIEHINTAMLAMKRGTSRAKQFARGMADSLGFGSEKESPLAKIPELAAEARERLRQLEAEKQERQQKELKEQEKLDNAKKRELRYEAELAAIQGDDGPLRKLEAETRLQEVKNQAIKDGLALKEQELAVQREHELQMARSLKEYQDAKADSDKIQDDFDNSISARGDKDLSRSLPSQQIRQGSVDEWMFEMQEKRRQEDAKAASDKALRDHEDRIEAANIIVEGFHEAYNNVDSITLEEV